MLIASSWADLPSPNFSFCIIVSQEHSPHYPLILQLHAWRKAKVKEGSCPQGQQNIVSAQQKIPGFSILLFWQRTGLWGGCFILNSLSWSWKGPLGHAVLPPVPATPERISHFRDSAEIQASWCPSVHFQALHHILSQLTHFRGAAETNWTWF